MASRPLVRRVGQGRYIRSHRIPYGNQSIFESLSYFSGVFRVTAVLSFHNRGILKSRTCPKIHKRCGSALESLGYSGLVKGGSGYLNTISQSFCD
jgi:hypothetical protein